jgi:hypothetical protein
MSQHVSERRGLPGLLAYLALPFEQLAVLRPRYLGRDTWTVRIVTPSCYIWCAPPKRHQ